MHSEGKHVEADKHTHTHTRTGLVAHTVEISRANVTPVRPGLGGKQARVGGEGGWGVKKKKRKKRRQRKRTRS